MIPCWNKWLNKYKTEKEYCISFLHENPIDKYRMKERNKKSPLEHHSNNCYRQALWNIKISRLILKEKYSIYIVSMYLTLNIY